MAYVINDECISCGACVSGCPVEAISEVLLIWKSTLMYVLIVVLVLLSVQ